MANINLMSEKKPTKVKRRASSGSGESSAPVIIFAAVVAVTLAVLVFWWMNLNNQIEANSKKIADAEAEKKRLEAIIKQVEEFQRQKELLERKINIIDELKRKQSGPVHMLDEISTAVPDFLWIVKLEELGRTLKIEGEATNIIAITNFVANMENSEWFSDVDLQQTTQVTQGYKYKIQTVFAPPRPKKPEGEGAAGGVEGDGAAGSDDAGSEG